MLDVAPGQIDEARRSGAAPTDGMDEGVVRLEGRIALDEAGVRPGCACHRLGGPGAVFGTQILGWRVHEIANHGRCPHDALDVRAIGAPGPYQLGRRTTHA